jgi:solute carrier family 25 thiamine pyrophosphate transporter 19
MGDVMLERMQSMEAHDSRKVFDDRGSTQQKVSKQQAKPSSMQSSRLMKSLVLFLAGSGAGIAATALTYPFDIMRTQFAVQGKDAPYKSMKSFVSSTLKSKGISGFYAGLGPAVIGIAPYMGLNFALYENSKQLLAKLDRYEPEKHSVVMNAVVNTLKQGLCGAFAGGLSKILVYPLDTIKKRMQIQVLKNTLDSVGSMPKYTSAMNCVTRTLQEEGVRGFYRGIVPTVIKSVVATSVTFAAYEGAKDFMEHRRKMNSLHGVKKMSIIHPKM